MLKHWYVYIALAVVAELPEIICARYRLIKSKPLRYVVAILVSTVICWCIYDFFIAPE